MSTLKLTNSNHKLIPSDYVIRMKCAFLSTGISGDGVMFFLADTDLENNSLLINN